MHYCQDCKIFVEDPKIKNFKINGQKHRQALCPVCHSKLIDWQPVYCRYCGSKLQSDNKDGYCTETCRRFGRSLWTRELRRRKKIKDDPIARILRMLTSYNREHNTRYSYGQFVSLVLPRLERKAEKAYGY